MRWAFNATIRQPGGFPAGRCSRQREIHSRPGLLAPGCSHEGWNCREGVGATMKRFLAFLGLAVSLTALMYAAWVIGRLVLPEGWLRPYFSRLFAARVGELSAFNILLANLIPFAGVLFMNLFKGNRWPGGLYVLPLFWIIYGLSLGTNSFIYAGQPVPLSLSVLWERMGFTELMAYTAGYEATRNWAIWEGFFNVRPIQGKKLRLTGQDWFYLAASLVLLVAAAIREVL